MKDKKVIQRALPLDVKYSIVSVSYLSLEDGGGCSCDNCGKLITNMASVKSDKGSYTIGLDCLDTILVNNSLLDNESYMQYLYSDKPAISKAKSLRSKILKKQKEDITFTATLYVFEGKDYFGFSFSRLETKTYRLTEDKKNIEKCAPYQSYDPCGFDYTFNPAYKELTLNYIKGLPNVILEG